MSRLGVVAICLLAVSSVTCDGNRKYDSAIGPFLKTLDDIYAIWFSNVSVPDLIEYSDKLIDTLFPAELPKFDDDIWWGDRARDQVDASIRPYEIHFDPEKIEMLLFKLDNRPRFKNLRNTNFTYGMNQKYLNGLMDYWLTKYDFQAREDKLNEYPQFITNIQGLDIHYYHIKPEATNKTIIPLLMLHGWPISNMEYIHMYPDLIKEKEGYDFVFEIVSATLPGFGYSEGTSKTGLSPYQMSYIFKNLMTRLGFKNFYIHAGDLGEQVATAMITVYQDDVMGLHTNFPYSLSPKTIAKFIIGSIQPSAVVEPEYEDRLYPGFKFVYYLIREFGYYHIHATKPDTLGVALLDSPSGMAAWLLTAMSWASNPNFELLEDGGLPQTFDIEDLLDVLTIMWDSEAIVTSIRLYAEFAAWFQDPVTLQILSYPTTVPYSCIKFFHELIYQPDEFIDDKFTNIVHSTTVDFGGHFEAFENTETLLEDLWEATAKMIEFNNEQQRYINNTCV